MTHSNCVVVGPMGEAQDYIRRAGWDQAQVATSAQLMRDLNPLRLATIHLVDVVDLGLDAVHAIAVELFILRTVWPHIRITGEVDVAAAVDAGHLPHLIAL